LAVAQERKADPGREQNRRRIYVRQRLPILKQELADLKTERAKLMEDVKTADDKKKAELRRRQTYVVARMAILRDEQKSMANEFKTLKESVGGKKKGAKSDDED
jgi:hypothetical protein